MIDKDCLDSIKAVAPSLTDEEAEFLHEKIRVQAEQLLSKNTGLTLQDAKIASAKDYSARVRSQQFIERRNAAFNLLAKSNLMSYAKQNFKEKPWEAFKAKTTGVAGLAFGARDNVDAYKKGLSVQYHSAVVSKLEKEGLMDVFASGHIDRNIFFEIAAISDQTHGKPGYTGSKEAKRIAEILYEVSEKARIDQNNVGASISKLSGWVVKRSHDMDKIREAGELKWISDMEERLDFDRTFNREQEDYDVMEANSMLLKKQISEINKKIKSKKKSKNQDGLSGLEASAEDIQQRIDDLKQEMRSVKKAIENPKGYMKEKYSDFASGVHIKTSGSVSSSPGQKGYGNKGKSASKDRVFHFKTPEDEFWYLQNYGHGNLREAYFQGLEYSASNTAIMKFFGPNAFMNFDSSYKNVMADISDPVLREKMQNKQSGIYKIFKTIDGTLNVNGGSAIALKYSRNILAFNQLVHLGLSTVSSLPEVAAYGSEMRFQGRSMFSATAEGIGALFKGRPSGWKKELAAQLGVIPETLIGKISERFSNESGADGLLGKGLKLLYKLNLENWKNDALKASSVLSMSHHLAINKNIPFGELREGLQKTIKSFGINENDWDLIREYSIDRDPDTGKEFSTIEKLDEIPDEVLSDNPLVAKKLRENLQDKMLTYFSDRSRISALVPDAGTRAIMTFGTQEGTPESIFFKHLFQFQSFTFAFTRQILGREMYGYNSKISAAKGIMTLAVAASMLGYVSYAAKEYIKGRIPKPPNDKKVLLASIMAGGGLGIYTQFLFGDMQGGWNRSPADTFMGPTFGKLFQLASIPANAREALMKGDYDDATDAVLSSLAATGRQNIPFGNLPWTKIPIDYLYLNAIQEAIDPGYIQKMEDIARRDREQEYWMDFGR